MNARRSTLRRAGAATWALLLAAIAAGPARGDVQLITNGGFEVGFNGWTRVDQVGSEGSFFSQSSTTSPVTGMAVPPPPAGLFAAMTDAEGPGAHVLYQDFVVPTGTVGGVLSFSLYVGNRANAFSTPNSLDFSTPTLNQQARVDLLVGGPGADPFSLATADVLRNAFRTAVGDPLVSGYATYTIDVGSVLASRVGQTLRLRFAEVDNVNLFQLGVDGVSLVASVPEPSSAVLAGLGLVAALAAARSRGRTSA